MGKSKKLWVLLSANRHVIRPEDLWQQRALLCCVLWWLQIDRWLTWHIIIARRHAGLTVGSSVLLFIIICIREQNISAFLSETNYPYNVAQDGKINLVHRENWHAKTCCECEWPRWVEIFCALLQLVLPKVLSVIKFIQPRTSQNIPWLFWGKSHTLKRSQLPHCKSPVTQLAVCYVSTLMHEQWIIWGSAGHCGRKLCNWSLDTADQKVLVTAL